MSLRCMHFALAKCNLVKRGNLNPYKKPPLCKGRGTAVAVEGLLNPIISFWSTTKSAQTTKKSHAIGTSKTRRVRTV